MTEKIANSYVIVTINETIDKRVNKNEAHFDM